MVVHWKENARPLVLKGEIGIHSLMSIFVSMNFSIDSAHALAHI